MRLPLRIRYSIGVQVGIATEETHGAFVASSCASYCAGLVVRRGAELLIASATAVELRRRYFLATAGHCLDDVEDEGDLHIVAPMSSRATGLPWRHRGSSALRGQGEEDLGWIELDTAIAQASGLRFLALDGAAEGETPPRAHSASRRVLVHGLPAQLASSRSSRRRHRLHLRALGLFSRTLARRKGDLELRIEYDHRSDNLQRGGLRRLPAAHGMSGGGVWQLSANGEPPRLAGLIRAWHRGDRELRCVPIERWVSWLGDCLPDLKARHPGASA